MHSFLLDNVVQHIDRTKISFLSVPMINHRQESINFGRYLAIQVLLLLLLLLSSFDKHKVMLAEQIIVHLLLQSLQLI